MTKLYLLKGFWQVPLTERASEISAFATPEEFLQYRVMAFASVMLELLLNIPNCETNLDDVGCYSYTRKQHLKTLNEVFDQMRSLNLTLYLSKCEFGCATVTYLGKEVGSGQVKPLNSEIQVIVDFPVPKTRGNFRYGFVSEPGAFSLFVWFS